MSKSIERYSQENLGAEVIFGLSQERFGHFVYIIRKISIKKNITWEIKRLNKFFYLWYQSYSKMASILKMLA